jgi:magnesium transporter
VDAIDKFAKIVEVNSILDRGVEENCTAVIFFGILQEIYQSLINELEYTESTLGNIEKGIFSGKEKDMVFALSEVSRNLLNFKKATDFHGEALDSLDMYGKKIFDEHFSYHVQRIKNEYSKVVHLMQNNSDSVSELRETNNSLLSTKQNEIMKVLTIVTFIVSPLALAAAVLQINTVANPIVGKPNDFWVILLFMALASLIMYSIFRFKKWL